MTDEAAYKLGWQAAEYGEKRSWCEQYGSSCLKGYDAYWDNVEEGLNNAQPCR